MSWMDCVAALVILCGGYVVIYFFSLGRIISKMTPYEFREMKQASSDDEAWEKFWDRWYKYNRQSNTFMRR